MRAGREGRGPGRRTITSAIGTAVPAPATPTSGAAAAADRELGEAEQPGRAARRPSGWSSSASAAAFGTTEADARHDQEQRRQHARERGVGQHARQQRGAAGGLHRGRRRRRSAAGPWRSTSSRLTCPMATIPSAVGGEHRAVGLLGQRRRCPAARTASPRCRRTSPRTRGRTRRPWPRTGGRARRRPNVTSVARRPPPWRRPGGSVSGSRAAAAAASTSPMPASTRKTPRQSVTCSSWAPSTGARIGAAPLTRISSANIRAASVPPARSRTTARAMTIPAAPARPCASRIAISAHTLGASAHRALASA